MKKNKWCHSLFSDKGCPKLLLIMKLSFVISFVFALTLSANTLSQNGKISLNLTDVTVKDVIKTIEAGSDYRFFYNDELSDISKIVSVNFKETQISEVLNTLFQNSGITYKVLENNLIVIAPETAIQPNKIIGKVTDASTSEPLPGVNVMIEGTNTGSTTDISGKYSIEVTNPDAVLVFSYIGYEPQRILVAGKTLIDIQMPPDVKTLEEVVVIGYGTVKKNDLTGSVGSVSSDDLMAKGTTSVMSALQGTLPGVNITTTSGKAGGNYSIQIRGQNSMLAVEPLYVVDGVVAPDISFLNPSDIERIDVLKDASSTAIYGSRGSSGVVLVQTKNANAKLTKTRVSYDAYFGFRKLSNLPEFMDGREWVDFRTSCFYTWSATSKSWTLASTNTPLNASPVLAQRLYEKDYEDWLDLATHTGHQQNHFLSIAGGNSDISYNIGLGYQKEEGNFIRESLDRFSAKASINHRASKYFQTGMNLNMSQTTVNEGSQYGYRDLMRLPDILHAYDDEGNIIAQPGIRDNLGTGTTGNLTSTANPLLEIAGGAHEKRRQNIISSFFAQVTPIEGLDFRSTISLMYNKNRDGKYYGVVTGNRSVSTAALDNSEKFDYTWDNQLSYTKVFGLHNINATLFSSMYHSRYEGALITSTGLPYDSKWYNVGSGTLVSDKCSSSFKEEALLSYAGRVNYEFMNRYLVTATVRYDGSSKLKEKWMAFPSFALAWRASEEQFMKFDWLTNLKFRFSFGYSGNNNINPYITQISPVTSSPVYYDYNATVVTGFAPGTPAYQKLTWEKTREANLGVDYGFLRGRINGSIDLYNKLSDGLLLPHKLALESGVKAMTDNVGSVRNKGVELSLNAIIVNSKLLQWSTTFTYARNVNEIVSLYGKKEDQPGDSWFIGEPIKVIYDYKINGVWTKAEYDAGESVYHNSDGSVQYTAKYGEAKTADASKDGILSTADKVILGSPDPKWTGSITSNLQILNFDFSFNIYTKQGVFVNDKFTDDYGYNTQRGMAKVKFDYYVPPNVPVPDWDNFTVDEGTGQATLNWKDSGEGHENAKYPIFKDASGAYYGNNGTYQDASFVKVKNITLGYTLPTKLVNKIKLSSLRVYANVLNPFTFTDYVGWDPEYATTEMDNGNGPSSTTYQFGVNVKF
jgi:TonB-dependent starch-binding outer membrane protein SusC